ncbi:hypothetical protein BC941DRAFT_439221 [Chlamydoabsidia padenii]|nr:hypothetical protein BC941DRAFT_439221 [Chlamydoabsidia padenii]
MEQEAICRVCRCEGSVEQPLFHPCKCSGSIRYVHQDCLMEWLAHSRKKHCELCEHPYSFTPVYRVDMPESIPLRLFLLQLAKKLTKLIYLVLRACLVACAWLFILPYFTINVWRFYFWSGQLLSDQIQQLQNYSASINQFHLSPSSTLNLNTTSYSGSPSSTTILELVTPTGTPFNQSGELTGNITTFPNMPAQFVILGQTFTTSDIRTFVADCFEGQVITFVTFVVFVAIFYLREWIVQNIPEELLDDNIEEPLIPENDPHDDLALLDFNDQQHEEGNEHGNVDNDLIFDRQGPLGLDGDSDSDSGNTHISEDEIDNVPPISAYRLWPHQVGMDNGDSSSSRAEHEALRNRRATSEPPMSRQLLDIDGDFTVFESANEDIDRQQRASSAEPGLQWYNSPSPFDDPSSSSHNFRHQPLGNFQQYNQLHADTLFPPHPQQGLDPIPEQHEDQHEQHWPQDNNFDNQRPQVALPPPRLDPQVPINDNDNNAEDDILDVLEAVGMRGSLWKLIQSIILIGLVISSCLGITVWMPYLIGMTFVMADVFDFIRVPFVLTRMVTDPVIDWLITLFTDMIWPTTIQSLESLSTIMSSYYTSITPITIQHTVTTMALHLSGLLNTKTPSLASIAITNNGTIDISSQLHHASTFELSILNSFESAFDRLLYWINQVEPSLKVLAAWYRNLAVGTSTMDRTICIVIGYIVALAMSSCYFSQSLARIIFGERAHGTIRQQYLILKTGFFLAIELFLFPIVCGALLDFSTMPLPSLSTIWGSLEHTWMNPVSSVFTYWFAGMVFMVMFTWLITNCREILRPGVMWFIRDPNDPQFHPIKEIIQRPIGSQLKKLGTSATMYALIIIIGVGGVAQVIHYFGHDFLPLQLNLSRPLVVMPFDLIIIHIIVPAINRYFRPIRVIKGFWIKWMQFVCRQLRLTSFMFGVRTMDEEGVMRYPTWSGWLHGTILQQHNHRQDGVLEWNGQLVRAPKHDGVRFILGRRMLVPVDTVTLLPLDENEREFGHPAARGPGGEEANTVIVYTPPRFKQRVILFMTILWISGSCLLCSLTILPLALGRYIFKEGFHLQVPVHDMYSYFVGGIIILLTGALVGYFTAVINDVVSQSNTTGRMARFVSHSRNLAHMVFKWSLVIGIFGVVIPLLFGMMMEMYLLVPVKDFGEKISLPDIMSVWIRGFACMNLFHGLLHVLPANSFQANLTQAFRRGVTNMNLWFLCSEVLGPLCLFCITALVVPFLISLVVIQLLIDSEDSMGKIEIIQNAYPISIMLVGSYYIGVLLVKMGRRWVQSIREDYYLVGRTLHNMGE